MSESNPQNKIRWKDDKKAYFKDYHSKTYICECGKTLKISSKSNHLRSLKHQLYMYKKEKEDMDKILNL